MLPSQTLAQIEALGLDVLTETSVIEIVEGAIARILPTGSALALQLPADWPANYREQFWARYPNKTAKPRALKALDKIAFAGKVRWSDLMAGLERYRLSPKVAEGFVKGPEKWLNDEGWNDQPCGRPKPKSLGFFEIASGHGD